VPGIFDENVEVIYFLWAVMAFPGCQTQADFTLQIFGFG
jgi:hypothetical protein